jgi:excisionase family DNA binding protein
VRSSHSAGRSRPSSPPDVVTTAAGTPADATELPPTISVEHAAKLLGVSRSAAYRAAASGQLPTLAFGRRLLVPTAPLLRMLGLSFEDNR